MLKKQTFPSNNLHPAFFPQRSLQGSPWRRRSILLQSCQFGPYFNGKNVELSHEIFKEEFLI